jgi:hypothetical protein
MSETKKAELIAKLRRGKEAMAARCREVAMRLAEEAGVRSWEYTSGLHGSAFVRTGHIKAPEPTTRNRLYVWAHECGHVTLKHNNTKPRHIAEYEAERWAHAALRRHGIAVPRKQTKRAKDYVARKIRQAQRRGAKHIDPAARNFAARA